MAGEEGSSANREFRMGEELLGKQVLKESKLEVFLIKRLDSYCTGSIHTEWGILGFILLQMNAGWVSSAAWKASVQVRDIIVYFLWKETKMLFLMTSERTQL